MSKPIPRKAIVDDRSTEIHYSGAWALDSAKPRNQIGIISSFIPASSHKAIEAGSSFSFLFQGSSVEVHGSVFGNASQSPIYDCFLDQSPIPLHDPPSSPGPWTMCDITTTNGPHTLTVNVTDPGPIGLWFDYIVYVPESQADITSGIYRIDKSDPGIVYSSGWGRFGDFANGTNTHNAQLSLNFDGQGISFLGYFAVEQPHSAAVAAYSIDGGSPANFSLDGIDNSTSSIFDLELFAVIGLTPGSHSLKVLYLGNTKQAPLALNYLQVLGSIPGSTPTNTTNGTSSPSSPTPQQSPTHDTPGQPAQHVPVGAIVGILVGVLFLVSAAVGLFFFLHKRKKSPRDIEGHRPSGSWFSKSRKTGLTQAHPDFTPYSFSTIPHTTIQPQGNPQSQNNAQSSAPSAGPIRRAQLSFSRRRKALLGNSWANPTHEEGVRRPPPAVARNISVMTEMPPQYSA